MIVLSPFCRLLRNGKRNPKEYPWWNVVVESLSSAIGIVQLGLGGEPGIPGVLCRYNDLPIREIVRLVGSADTWLSCDSFLPHLCHIYRLKPGVVVWGKSDPDVFGYDTNINLLRDRRCLRQGQFEPWEAESYDHRVFVRPRTVVESVLSLINKKIATQGGVNNHGQ